MSLITRCPTCETLFKVVPDQLRISDGWVRCGQCDDIFDASLHLLPGSPVEDVPVVPPEELAENNELTAPPDLTPASVEVSPESACETPQGESPLVHELLESDSQEVAIAPASPDLIQDEFSPLDDDVPLVMVLPEHEENANAADNVPDGDLEVGEVTFLHGKQKDFFWRKPILRVALLFLSLALPLGLVGQIVFSERDRIVALEPGFKPWLQAICIPLNCTLSPLRRIESIVIESSSFTKIRGDSYRLNLMLKNTAATALAVPAIELTLTDAFDLPVVRRVFLAAELGVKSDTLTVGAEWPASLAMLVKTTGASDRVAGYRLLAFYP